ncbi:MAG: metal-dependent hydrolase [Methanoregula sp.]|uniref:metal-dependent hydrolase n=1 Tax=Methanoregula sp. TaxID=2052170 RepID=UPI003BAE485E
MLAEHIIYNAAIAIIVGMLFVRYFGRDTTWIIILVSWAPDLDLFAKGILNKIGITLLFYGQPIQHGTFHNIAAMVIFGIIVAFLLAPFGLRFFDSMFFAMIGFGGHLFEDALVYLTDYRYFWPFSNKLMGLSWLPVGTPYKATFFHIANTEVLVIGLVLLSVAIMIRTRVEGHGWIRWYMPDKVYQRFFAKTSPS